MNKLPSGWQVKSLGELCVVVRGSSPRPKSDSRFYGGNVPRLMVADLTRDGMYVTPKIDYLTEEGSKQSRLMKAGDVIIAVSGNPGLTAILNINAFIHDGFVGLRNLDKYKIYNEYLYHYLTLLKRENKAQAVGAIFKNLTTDQIGIWPIPFPPLPIQRQIAEILEKADQAKQKRRGANNMTEQFLQSAFIEMFGDPVKNPKRWEKERVENISSLVTSGSTPLGGNSNYLTEGIQFIRSQNILMNKIDFSDIVYISEDVHKKMRRTWVHEKDVLLNITGASIGRVAKFDGPDNSANVNQHVCIIRPIEERINYIFLSFLISSPAFQTQVISKNAGATRQAFNFEQIKNFEIIVPPNSLQQKFAQLVQKTEELKEKQKKSEIELENLFNSLMQKAFKGELV